MNTTRQHRRRLRRMRFCSPKGPGLPAFLAYPVTLGADVAWRFVHREPESEFLTGCPSCGSDGGRHGADCDLWP